MKKTSFFIILLCVAFGSLRAQEKLVLNAFIAGMPDDSVITLYGFRGADRDSAVVKNHSFHFDRKLKDGGDVYVLKFGSGTATMETSLLTYLGPGEVNIKGTWPAFGQSVITGPPFVEEFKDANRMMQDSLIFSHGDGDLNAEMAEALQVGDRERYKQLQEAERNQRLMLKELATKWVMNHLNSGVSAFVINVAVSTSAGPDEVLGLMDKLTPAAQKNAYMKTMREQMKELKTVNESGKPSFGFGDSLRAGAVMAPDFTCTDTLGRQVSLKDFRGKYVLVDFWASWCGPCRMGNPDLKAMYEKYKDKNFTILGVSLDTQKEPWTKAIRQDKLPWPQVSDLAGGFTGRTAELYHIGFIPTNYLVDPQGKIIGSFVKDAQSLEQVLQALHITLE